MDCYMHWESGQIGPHVIGSGGTHCKKREYTDNSRGNGTITQ
jgi:hypothetical protein